MMSIQLLSTYTKNNLMLFLLLNFNILAIYLQVIFFYLEEGGDADDPSALGMQVIAVMILLVVFSFMNNKNIVVSATQNIKHHEFEQYRTMFNSL